MTGAPPYGVQSPTQQARFTAYSPPNKNSPYYPNNEQYQQPAPQTPSAFPPPAPLARSPHFSQAPSPLPATLPPLNGSAPPPPHAEAPSQYPAHSSTGAPQYSIPPPYAGSVPGSASAPYNHTSHAHPSSRPEALSQSPKKEPESSFDVRGNGYSSQSPVMRGPRPASPKEAVRFLTLTSHLI